MESSPLFITSSLNLNGGMLLVKGSPIINSILICPMITLFSLTCSIMAKYLMLVCLLPLPLLLFLTIKTVSKLSQYILNSLWPMKKIWDNFLLQCYS